MLRIAFLTCCIVLVGATETTYGQLFDRFRERRERQTPEEREQRRERVVEGVRGLFEQFNQPQNVRIEFPRINRIIDAVLQVLVARLPQLERAHLAFAVDRSSFEGNAFVVEGDLAGWAPWDSRDPPQLSSATFTVSAELLQPTNNNVLIELDMQTDVIGLVNFGLQRLVASPVASRVEPTRLGPEYAEIQMRTLGNLQQALSRVGPVYTLDDVVYLTPIVGPINLHGLHERISYLKSVPVDELPPEEAKGVAAELRKTNAELDALIAMSTLPHRDTEGRVRAISISLPEGLVVGDGMANVTGLVADVTPATVHVGATLGVTQSGIFAYQGSKLVVGPWLARKQQEIDPENEEQVNELAEEIEGRLEEFLPPPAGQTEDLPPPEPPREPSDTPE